MSYRNKLSLAQSKFLDELLMQIPEIYRSHFHELLETINKISQEDQRQLDKLSALEAGGVENWEWYDSSLDDWREQCEDEEEAAAASKLSTPPGTSWQDLSIVYVTGTQMFPYCKAHGRIEPGTIFQLEANPENEFDSFAVRVLAGGTQLGWIARGENQQAAVRLASGETLVAEVLTHYPEAAPLQRLRVQIKQLVAEEGQL